MGVGRKIREGAGDSPATSPLGSYLTALTQDFQFRVCSPSPSIYDPRSPGLGLRGPGDGQAGTVGKFSEPCALDTPQAPLTASSSRGTSPDKALICTPPLPPPPPFSKEPNPRPFISQCSPLFLSSLPPPPNSQLLQRFLQSNPFWKRRRPGGSKPPTIPACVSRLPTPAAAAFSATAAAASSSSAAHRRRPPRSPAPSIASCIITSGNPAGRWLQEGENGRGAGTGARRVTSRRTRRRPKPSPSKGKEGSGGGWARRSWARPFSNWKWGKGLTKG